MRLKILPGQNNKEKTRDLVEDLTAAASSQPAGQKTWAFASLYEARKIRKTHMWVSLSLNLPQSIYKTTGKIIVLHILIFMHVFLDSKQEDRRF
jgi:hypothetical protein